MGTTMGETIMTTVLGVVRSCWGRVKQGMILMWSIGTHGACTGRRSRCGTWIVDAMLNIYDISNLYSCWVFIFMLPLNT
uniref:Uncharacterized protein n=1 Tax=Helianthus annuus TaxID=4232 RepID=A0A251SP36_HELAN